MGDKLTQVIIALCALLAVVGVYAILLHGPGGESAPYVVIIDGERFLKTYAPRYGYQYEYIGRDDSE